MRDKLTIIASIQYVVEQTKMLLSEPRGSKSPEKLGVLKGFSLVMIQFHYAISGDHWTGSPQDLMQWLIKYCKDEADKLDPTSRGNILTL